MKIITGTNLLLFFILTLFFAVYFVLSVPYFSGDVKNHIVWGRSILEESPKGFYGRYFHDYSFPNYPPVSMLSFAGSVWLFDGTKQLVTELDKIPYFPSVFVTWMNEENVEVSFLKIPAILPFVLTAALIFYFAKSFKFSNKKAFKYLLLFLLNPAFFYLAVVWGQNDFTQVLFILLAIYFLFKKSFYLSVIFAGFSILSKQTVLMVWGIFILTLIKVFNMQKAVIGVLVSVILLWLMYMPFNENSLLWPFAFYNETLRTTGLLVADNAVNFWGVLSRFRPADSQEVILNLKLEYWGFLFFSLLFLPLLYKYLKSKFTNERFFYFLFMASIVYFFTLTRMHERYLIFGVVFSFILTMLNKNHWFNLVFFSSLLFLNMYKGLYMPDWPLIVDLLNSVQFLSILGVGYLGVLAVNYYNFMYRLRDEKN